MGIATNKRKNARFLDDPSVTLIVLSSITAWQLTSLIDAKSF